MTEELPADVASYQQAKVRRRRARRIMRAVTVVCILAAAAIGAEQVYSGGTQPFLDRPAGVGATPPR